MNRIFSLVLLTLTLSLVAIAAPVDAPEIDPASGSAALAALSGVALMIRSRARR